MSERSYFVTGGLGFLGQYVVTAIRRFDPVGDIRVLDLGPRSTLLGIESLPGVQVIFGDLRKPETFAAELTDTDTVVHCAGIISFRSSSERSLFETNIIGTLNLLRAALDRHCHHFLYISSISTIGILPGQISDETMVADIVGKQRSDPYGYSKLVCELALQAKKERIRVVILNPSVILGPGSMLIDKVIRHLRWIPCCPVLGRLNSFVDVRDVARAVTLSLATGASGERYIVTTENIDNLCFVRLVMETLGRTTPVFAIPDSALDLYDRVVGRLEGFHLNPGLKKSAAYNVDKAYSAAKIRRELGWQPVFSLQQSVIDMVSASGYRHEADWKDRLAYRRL